MTVGPTPAAVLKDLLAAGRVRFRKSLSQHFLTDPRALEGLVRALGPGPEDVVIEIGPGAGFLTERLVATGARVIAVEVDGAMATLLRERIPSPRLTIMVSDFLRVTVAELAAAAGATRVLLAGNLPYHVTTPLLFHVLPDRDRIARMVFTVQREVGARLCARPGSKDYGALTVAIAHAGVCERLFGIGAGAFVPAPRISSVAVRLVPAPVRLAPAGERRLNEVTRASFGHRRKTLANALAELSGGREGAVAALARAGIDPGRRGETLTLAEFERLAACFG